MQSSVYVIQIQLRERIAKAHDLATTIAENARDEQTEGYNTQGPK